VKRANANRRAGLVLAALGGVGAWTLTHAVVADVANVSSAISDKIRASLKEHYPDIAVHQIHAAPLPGLYEIVLDDQIIYTDETGQYLLVGRLVDSKTKEDLSAKSWNQANAIDFSTLPLDLAIKTVKGDGSRAVAIFEDPRCPFCKQLEQQMASVTNITLYRFLFPLEQIHPGATEVSNRIWCAQDRAGAWSVWMALGNEPEAPAPACDTAVIGKLQDLGAKLRINSTPTLFFADGTRARGAMSAEALEAALNKYSTSREPIHSGRHVTGEEDRGRPVGM
jgi:thiol:disulfide interchange protein DsbC